VRNTSKQLEGRDIELLKNIKGSISKKIFISMVAILMVCCAIIYSLVLYFMPRNFYTELESRFANEFNILVETLQIEGWQNSSQDIIDFSINNQATITIMDSDRSEVFSISEMVATVGVHSIAAEFQYDNQIYYLVATASFLAVEQSLNVLVGLLPLTAVVIIFISIISAYAYSRYFSKPLISISDIAKRMTKLDLVWECDETRSDEIGVLSTSLNVMSKKLAEALDNLQMANKQLQADIEAKQRQEKQRIDFFTAVSHELKTPITVVKGELEGMIHQVGDYKDRDTYLRHSLKTIVSMEKLVKEILLAARMGGDDFLLNKEDFSISEMVKKCSRNVQGIAEDKEMNIHMDLQPNVHYHGDELVIKQAISNIIGNAVHYSPEKANIYICLNNSELSIENTEVHISKEDIEQIFLPFYRADKSRNRNTGGSGLGLYISKTIFDHHGILYRIENTEKGVKFTITFR